MKLFEKTYEVCIRLAAHPKATLFLVVSSFIESIFWPIPCDAMLVPMALARPNRAMHYATLTMAASVAGAVCGYYLGYFVYDPYIADCIEHLNYDEAMHTVRSWYTKEYGILMVFIGAFTPVPYKVIAITTGVVAAEAFAKTGSHGMINILNFILISIVGRGMRYYLIAWLIKLGGEKMEKAIHRYIDIIGWICVVLFAAYVLYKIYL